MEMPVLCIVFSILQKKGHLSETVTKIEKDAESFFYSIKRLLVDHAYIQNLSELLLWISDPAVWTDPVLLHTKMICLNSTFCQRKSLKICMNEPMQ